MPINVQNPATLAQTPTTQAESAPTLGRDDFMKLLIAQLKNQDPLNPMDARESITQLSQLTSVEELRSMSDRLRSLQGAMSSMVDNQASGLIGKRVEADGSQLVLGQQGGAGSAITLSAGAEQVTLTVRDAEGEVVRTMELGRQLAGSLPVEWNGMLDGGTRAEPGSYRLSVSAKDGDGNPIEVSAQVKGTVGSVSYEQGYPELVVGGARVALASVTSISN